MKPIPNWRSFHKFWSVRLSVLGSVVTSLLIAFPDAWHMLPPELKAAIPERYLPLVGVAFIIASIVARGVKQTKLDPPDRNHANDRQ